MTGPGSHPSPTSFAARHIGPDRDDVRHMLDTVGRGDLQELMRAAVPAAVRAPDTAAPSLPAPATEHEALADLRRLAAANTVNRSLIGQGYYGTVTPPVIVRNILENPSWYTAYTPYQPEISQGRLEALLTFQTLVTDLTGTATANASMLDEATAAVEGMLLARRAARATSPRFLVDTDVFAQTLAVLRGRAGAVGIELVECDLADPAVADRELAAGAFGMLVQYPAASGRIRDLTPLLRAVSDAKGISVVAADLLALTLLAAPGALGADVVVGSSQRFGVPMGFGGPHAGYMGVRKGLERQLPGRLVGVSRDAAGDLAYRLALQTREQHIRRERATSNICTAQVLLAVMAAMYAVYHGPEGLRAIAASVHARTGALAARLRAAGVAVVHEAFFDTLELDVPGRARDLATAAHDAGWLLFAAGEDRLRLSLDETVSDADLDLLVPLLSGGAVDATPEPPALGSALVGQTTAAAEAETGTPIGRTWPAGLRREDEVLTHPVFRSFHSETAMMRFLKRLADKDYALDRGMIPLGSCTMKLNAAAEMEAITWPEFAQLHPFAPAADTAGYRELTGSLETWLADLTGYDTVSLQPNAGSQGEYAGLAAIRGWHLSRGDDQRTVCLVPSSAHGTNAASAVLAGLKVVVVASSENGDIDVEDLSAKITEHGDTIAAIMLTYPSTHGVYETRVRDVCSLVHEAGGQVYVDGANLNALLGHAKPGEFGGDVSHLNLHKTFCIPHGGGGPGVGPVAAKAHLAPFLPGHGAMQHTAHPLAGGGTVEHGGAPVSAAPYGSPSILPISWAYVRMMGADGLADATAHAVLAANYIAERLRPAYPILYTGENGLVAHECIVDLRPLTERTGITVDDVAKRLVDYGFHAPTMSFPVAGTLMVEPTESEDLAELDRFCDAMLGIAAEAEQVASGEWPADDNPLVNAPHTAVSLTAQEWAHPYSRAVAVYPGVASGDERDRDRHADRHMNRQMRIQAKYWPAVARVDNAFGDRNLACSCPPISAYDQD